MNGLWVIGGVVVTIMLFNVALLLRMIDGLNQLLTMFFETRCMADIHEWTPATAWPWQQRCARCGILGVSEPS